MTLTTPFKTLVDRAIEWGKDFDHPHSGFFQLVPFWPKASEKEGISLALNFLWVMTKIKTHTQENILEAKKLLSHLLAFQISEGPSKGAFPHLLHQYPYPTGIGASIEAALVLLALYKNYAKIFSQVEKEQINQCLDALLSFLIQDILSKESPSDYHTLSVYVCLALSKDTALDELAKSHLKQLKTKLDTFCFQSPSDSYEDMGKKLLLWHLLPQDQELFVPSLKQAIEKMAAFWSPFFHQSIGAMQAVCFDGLQVKESLFSLLFRLSTDPKDIKKECFNYNILYASLLGELKPLATLAYPFSMSETFSSQQMRTFYHEEKFALSYWTTDNQEAVTRKDAYPIQCFFEDSDTQTSYSLFCQTLENIENIEFKDDSLDFDLHIKQEREDASAPIFSFYVSKFPGLKVLINDQSATCFRFCDDICLKTKSTLFKVSFRCLGHEDKYLGHIALGNRPSQEVKSEKAFPDAYDWHLYIRNLDLTPGSRIGVKIRRIQL